MGPSAQNRFEMTIDGVGEAPDSSEARREALYLDVFREETRSAGHEQLFDDGLDQML